MTEIADMVTTVYPKVGAVVSTVGCLHVVQDLQGRLVEVAVTIVTDGKMKVSLASDNRSRLRRENKLRAGRAASRRYRAKLSVEQRVQANKRDVAKRRLRLAAAGKSR